MSKLKKKLAKKIDLSNLFVVLVTKNYIEELRNLNGEILTSIRTAVELKKPFFIIVDSRLTKEEKDEIDNYFHGYDIIKRMEIDIKNKQSIDIIAREIKQLVWEMTGDDKSIRVITVDSSEEEDAKD